MAIFDFTQDIPTTLFIGRRRDFSLSSDIESINFNLLLSESHNLSNEVTVYNIEDGGDISDNIRLALRTGGITGFISNLSIQKATSIDDPYTSPENSVQEAFNALKRIRESKELVTIVTNLEIYENVAITDISVVRESGDGEGQEFSISFQEVRVVKLKSVAIDTTVNIKFTDTNRKRQASQKINLGRTTGRTK